MQEVFKLVVATGQWRISNKTLSVDFLDLIGKQLVFAPEVYERVLLVKDKLFLESPTYKDLFDPHIDIHKVKEGYLGQLLGMAVFQVKDFKYIIKHYVPTVLIANVVRDDLKPSVDEYMKNYREQHGPRKTTRRKSANP